MKVAMVSLGCAKNQVDAQTMLSLIAEAGYAVVHDPALADVIVVNTCGFIQSAKEESIGTILDMASYKTQGSLQALIVTGCLSQRYGAQMEPDLPEVDAFVGIGHIDQIVTVIRDAVNGRRAVIVRDPYRFVDAPVLPIGPAHTAYLKVGDGCDNRCSYCAIPLIRGGALSKPMDKLLEEARALADLGVKELIPIAQDTTRYGQDLYGEPKLLDLLEQLCRIPGIEWVRPLYLYPDWLSREYLTELAGMDKVCKYLDLPIQHANDEVLTNMRRRGSQAHLREIFETAKGLGFALRTTVICGFPGETQAQHEELLAFIKEVRFDRLGAFAYSQEEDTDAAQMEQLPLRERESRAQAVMRTQRRISKAQLGARVGRTEKVLIEGTRQDALYGYYGRSQFEAPEVDGQIFVKGDLLSPGQFVDVRITKALDYDLCGEVAP